MMCNDSFLLCVVLCEFELFMETVNMTTRDVTWKRDVYIRGEGGPK